MSMKSSFNNIIYFLAIIFLFGCDSSSTSSLVNNDNNGSNGDGNTNNSDLQAGFSNFISEYKKNIATKTKFTYRSVTKINDKK